MKFNEEKTVGKWTWNCLCPLNPSAGASKMPPGKHFTDSTDFLASAQSEHRRTSAISRALQTNKRCRSPDCWTTGPGRLYGHSDFAISVYIRYQKLSRPVFWDGHCWGALQVSFSTVKLYVRKLKRKRGVMPNCITISNDKKNTIPQASALLRQFKL